MRLETTDISIRNLRRERMINRSLLVLAWVGTPLLIRLAPSAGTICVTPIGLLLATSWIVGTAHGAPIAAVRTPGKLGDVAFDEGGVTVTIAGRARRFERAEIVAGWTERYVSGAEDVVIEMRPGELLRFGVPDAAQARAALRAAGVAPTERAVSLRLGVSESSSARVLMIMLTIVVGLLAVPMFLVALYLLFLPGHHEGPVFLLVSLLSLVAFYILLEPLITTTVRVGTDGIVVERLFRRRFVARKSFMSATTIDKRILIEAVGGSIDFAVSSANEAQVVAARIREAMTEQEAAAESVAARLDRHGRSIDAWLRDVKGLARAASGYRDARIELDELAAIASDGGAKAERRIAAAAALASDDAGKRRARIAAEACVDLDLRVAIEQAAEEEIDETKIVRALSRTEK